MKTWQNKIAKQQHSSLDCLELGFGPSVNKAEVYKTI